jgi:hypothetical protein
MIIIPNTPTTINIFVVLSNRVFEAVRLPIIVVATCFAKGWANIRVLYLAWIFDKRTNLR